LIAHALDEDGGVQINGSEPAQSAHGHRLRYEATTPSTEGEPHVAA
jgi:hypothetical protein